MRGDGGGGLGAGGEVVRFTVWTWCRVVGDDGMIIGDIASVKWVILFRWDGESLGECIWVGVDNEVSYVGGGGFGDTVEFCR